MNLLVGADGSDESETALAFATDLLDAVEGSITLVHAVEPDIQNTDGTRPLEGLADADRRLIRESVEDAEDRGLPILEDAAAVAEGLGHDVDTELLYGDPVNELTDYAEDGSFDLIVVGHRGHSERTELMLGSVAKDIVERATVPVTVVR